MNSREERIWFVGGLDYIEEGMGIELLWGEKAAFRHYMRCFDEVGIEGRLGIGEWPIANAVQLFVLDYFGVDGVEMGNRRGLAYKNGRFEVFCFPEVWGTPEFKEYCRERVDMWREERSLPEHK